MAELDGTQIDLETGDTPTSDASQDAAPTQEQQELLRLREENAELQRAVRTRQHNQQANDEARRLSERIAALEGRSTPSQADRTQAQTLIDDTPDLTEDELDAALTKWLNNDKSGLSTIRKALKRPSSSTKVLSEADIDRLVDTRVVSKLSEIGTRSNMQSIVAQRHKELADPKSPLSRDIFENYESYASDPENALLYPKDSAAEVPMYGPDGTLKMVNARLVDRLCAELKLSGAHQQGRQSEARDAQYGSAQSGHGSTSRSNPRRFVEALELLTPGERAMMQSRETLRGWPQLKEAFEKGGEKGAAKYLFGTFDKADQDRRLANYRDKQGRAAS